MAHDSSTLGQASNSMDLIPSEVAAEDDGFHDLLRSAKHAVESVLETGKRLNAAAGHLAIDMTWPAEAITTCSELREALNIASTAALSNSTILVKVCDKLGELVHDLELLANEVLLGRVAGLELEITGLKAEVTGVKAKVIRREAEGSGLKEVVAKQGDQINIQGEQVSLEAESAQAEDLSLLLIKCGDQKLWRGQAISHALFKLRQIAAQLPNKLARLFSPENFKTPYAARHVTIVRLQQDKSFKDTEKSAFLQRYPMAPDGILVLNELGVEAVCLIKVLLPVDKLSTVTESDLRAALAEEFETMPLMLEQTNAVLDALVAASLMLNEDLFVDTSKPKPLTLNPVVDMISK